MRSRNRSLAILLCLFLISFKVTAGSIFIDAAIERAQIQQSLFSGISVDHVNASREATDGQQQSHSLFLMSHVVANVSDGVVITPFKPSEVIAFNDLSDVLFTQNFPDSVFKPPKIAA